MAARDVSLTELHRARLVLEIEVGTLNARLHEENIGAENMDQQPQEQQRDMVNELMRLQAMLDTCVAKIDQMGVNA